MPTPAAYILVVILVASTTGYDGRHDLGLPHRLAYLARSVVALYAPMTAVQVTAAAVALAGLGLPQMNRLPAVVTPSKE